MTTKNLIKVALRYKAVFLDIDSEEVPIAAHGGNDSLTTSMPCKDTTFYSISNTT